MKLGLFYHLKLWVKPQGWQWIQYHRGHEAARGESSPPWRLGQRFELIFPIHECLIVPLLLDASWHGKAHLPQFLEAVRIEVAYEIEHLKDYLLDARCLRLSAEGLEVEAALLSKARVRDCLAALPKGPLHLYALWAEEVEFAVLEGGLSPLPARTVLATLRNSRSAERAHLPEQQTQRLFNFLPWRQKQQKIRHLKRFIRLAFLPLLTILFLGSWFCHDKTALNHQQKTALRLQKQLSTYQNPSGSTLTLGEGLRLLQHLQGIDHLKIDANGNVELAGVAPLATEVSSQIHTVGETPGLEKGSLHDLEVQRQNGRTLWQARFVLARDPS